VTDQPGTLQTVMAEEQSSGVHWDVELTETVGNIQADLTVGADVAGAEPVDANEDIASAGVKLHGSGFIVDRERARQLGLKRIDGLEKHIRRYRNGRDLTQSPRGVFVIDLFGLDEVEVREQFPAVYQHVKEHVKPEREQNNRESYRKYWWIHGEARSTLRDALSGLNRYVATPETAKHRFFQFLDVDILPDNMVIAFALEDAYHLGVLSSRIHVQWSLAAGGTLEDRPRYTKTQCFDPFPFPSAS
jgi:hypothetical protein